jgi:hypothetical protein
MNTVKIPTTINAAGIQEIKEFLQANHKLCVADPDYFDAEMLNAWAAKAEFQLGEGNSPSVEIKSYDSVSGATIEYTISDAGVDCSDVEIDD